MFKLCNFIKDDREVCNAPAMRRHQFCFHHLERLRRERRADRTRQRFMQAILKDHPLNSLPSVQQAMQRILDGVSLGRLDRKQSQVMLSGLRLMASNLRYMPELADLHLEPQAKSALTKTRKGGSPCG